MSCHLTTLLSGNFSFNTPTQITTVSGQPQVVSSDSFRIVIVFSIPDDVQLVKEQQGRPAGGGECPLRAEEDLQEQVAAARGALSISW